MIQFKLKNLLKKKTVNIKGKNILAKELRMSMNGRETHRNNNILVITGQRERDPIAAKVYDSEFIKANLQEANSSYVVHDPGGFYLESMGPYLEKQGYDVQVLNLLDTKSSLRYNPFAYIHNDKDVERFVETIYNNEMFQQRCPGRNKTLLQTDEKFKAAYIALMQSLVFFFIRECKPADQTFENMVELLEIIYKDYELYKDYENAETTFEFILKDFEKKDLNHPAVRQYKIFKENAGEKEKGVIIACQFSLTIFKLSQLKELTKENNLNLEYIGERKTAFFCVTPCDDTFNLLSSLFFSQLLETLSTYAEKTIGHSLPIHVRIISDDILNMGYINDFGRFANIIRPFNMSYIFMTDSIETLKIAFSEEYWDIPVFNSDILICQKTTEEKAQELMCYFCKQNTSEDKVSSAVNITGKKLLIVSDRVKDLPKYLKRKKVNITRKSIEDLSVDQCIVNIRSFNSFICTKISP